MGETDLDLLASGFLQLEDIDLESSAKRLNRPQLKSGTFQIWWNKDRNLSQLKGANRSRLSFVPGPCDDRQVQILKLEEHCDLNQAKEMAAFLANGISWSKERSVDQHYSHLVEAAAQWTQIGWLNLMDLSYDLLILIQEEFLDKAQLERAVAIPRKSDYPGTKL